MSEEKKERFRGRRVLVTGATGLIGTRLVERLVTCEGAEVVALVHQFKSVSRIARFNVPMIQADVADRPAVVEAAKGCDHIVHCAVSFAGSEEDQRKVIVGGLENVCAAAREHRMKSVVSLSTLSVYGTPSGGSLSEESPRKPSDLYGKLKKQADDAATRAAGEGVNVVTLAPTIVFGPWSFWSTYVIGQMEAGRVLLPGEGKGTSNAVFIDDVVESILLALDTTGLAGEQFLISSPEKISWPDFYKGHHHAESEERLQAVTTRRLKSIVRRGKWVDPFKSVIKASLGNQGTRDALVQLPLFGRLALRFREKNPSMVNRVVGSKNGAGRGKTAPASLAPQLPHPLHFDLLGSRMEVDCSKAKRLLGFEASHSHDEALRHTRDWAAWANLYPEEN